MALATYTDLLASIADWLARSDLTSVIPDFVTLFEADMNKALLVRAMETSTTLTPSGGSATLPTDFLDSIRVTWQGSPTRDLQYVHPSYFAIAYSDNPSDNPVVFTIEGTTLKVMPLDNTSIVLLYRQKVPALVTNSTNWLLTAHPDIYLAGCMSAAYVYIKDFDKAQMWNGVLQGKLDALRMLNRQTRSPSSMRSADVTP